MSKKRRNIRVSVCEFVSRPSKRGTMPKPGTYHALTVHDAKPKQLVRAIATALRAQGYSLAGDADTAA